MYRSLMLKSNWHSRCTSCTDEMISGKRSVGYRDCDSGGEIRVLGVAARRTPVLAFVEKHGDHNTTN